MADWTSGHQSRPMVSIGQAPRKKTLLITQALNKLLGRSGRSAYFARFLKGQIAKRAEKRAGQEFRSC